MEPKDKTNEYGWSLSNLNEIKEKCRVAVIGQELESDSL